jgi:hypothetical protein
MPGTQHRSIDVIGNISATGDILNDRFVVAIVSTTNATGGSTDAILTVQLYQADGTKKVTSARQVQVIVGTAQHAPSASSAVSFSTATAGTIKGGGTGYRVVETDVTGAFSCKMVNASDGTYYAAVHNPFGVASGDESKQSSVLASTSASVVWSA